MIRKVPKIHAWVLKYKDIHTLYKSNHSLLHNSAYYYKLPILQLPCFSITSYDASFLFDDEDPILIMEGAYGISTEGLELVELINNIWNEFYETSTRK